MTEHENKLHANFIKYRDAGNIFLAVLYATLLCDISDDYRGCLDEADDME